MKVTDDMVDRAHASQDGVSWGTTANMLEAALSGELLTPEEREDVEGIRRDFDTHEPNARNWVLTASFLLRLVDRLAPKP